MYTMYLLRKPANHKTKLSSHQKRELSKAVKKTVKQYHLTLKLLAKT